MPDAPLGTGNWAPSPDSQRTCKQESRKPLPLQGSWALARPPQGAREEGGGGQGLRLRHRSPGCPSPPWTSWEALVGTSLTLCLLLCKTEQCHPLPGACLGAQNVKNLPGVQETWVQSLGREDPLEKETATHSSVLAWRTSWGRKELDTTERLSLAHSLIAWGRGSRGHRVCEALGQGWKLGQFPGRPLQQRPPLATEGSLLWGCLGAVPAGPRTLTPFQPSLAVWLSSTSRA